jgi:sulfur carrier protein ThiS
MGSNLATLAHLQDMAHHKAINRVLQVAISHLQAVTIKAHPVVTIKDHQVVSNHNMEDQAIMDNTRHRIKVVGVVQVASPAKDMVLDRITSQDGSLSLSGEIDIFVSSVSR